MLSFIYSSLRSEWPRFFSGCRPLKFLSWTRGHVIVQLVRCLCLRISAQVLTKTCFQQIIYKAKISPVLCICPLCLSTFCFGLVFFLQCFFLFLCSVQDLLPSLLSFVHLSQSLLSSSCALAYFLPGFPPCFLSAEPCFGMGQEVVFKLTFFWSLLICTLGGAFLLRIICLYKWRSQGSWRINYYYGRRNKSWQFQ